MTTGIEALRAVLARDGVFNTRDLGGIRTADGRVIAPGRVVRGDALQRVSGAAVGLRDYGLARVIDLRDERERGESGVFTVEGIEVEHHPVIDPTFAWYDRGSLELEQLLTQRYREILGAFGPRLAGVLTSIAEVVGPDQRGGAVAYHCAVGKDRTGLVTALLLSLLGVPDDAIVADYARSAAATAVQVQWLWALGLPGGETTDEELSIGVWSARPATMSATLEWLTAELGGVERYLAEQGLDRDAAATLRAGLLLDPER
ncbi:MAG: tyrosine-protein phosphatase [Microthrixaceae bacterium]